MRLYLPYQSYTFVLSDHRGSIVYDQYSFGISNRSSFSLNVVDRSRILPVASPLIFRYYSLQKILIVGIIRLKLRLDESLRNQSE